MTAPLSDTIIQVSLLVALALVILIPAFAWAIRAGSRKRLRNLTKHRVGIRRRRIYDLPVN